MKLHFLPKLVPPKPTIHVGYNDYEVVPWIVIAYVSYLDSSWDAKSLASNSGK